jgi:aminoglycoside 6'-N-acetyltransferase I
MIIEKLSTENIRAFAELSVALWPDADLADQVSYYSRMVGAEDATCYLIRDGSAPLGFIELSLRSDHVEGSRSSPTAYIEGLYVRPEKRNQDIGRALIKLGEQWAMAHGLNQLASDSEIFNAQGIAFHTAVGFEEAVRTVHFIKEIGTN